MLSLIVTLHVLSPHTKIGYQLGRSWLIFEIDLPFPTISLKGVQYGIGCEDMYDWFFGGIANSFYKFSNFFMGGLIY